jgi:hypothetical protein
MVPCRVVSCRVVSCRVHFATRPSITHRRESRLASDQCRVHWDHTRIRAACPPNQIPIPRLVVDMSLLCFLWFLCFFLFPPSELVALQPNHSTSLLRTFLARLCLAPSSLACLHHTPHLPCRSLVPIQSSRTLCPAVSEAASRRSRSFLDTSHRCGLLPSFHLVSLDPVSAQSESPSLWSASAGTGAGATSTIPRRALALVLILSHANGFVSP